jgi:hypothetical protein
VASRVDGVGTDRTAVRRRLGLSALSPRSAHRFNPPQPSSLNPQPPRIRLHPTRYSRLTRRLGLDGLLHTFAASSTSAISRETTTALPTK